MTRKLLPVAFSALLLVGCQSLPGPDEFDRLQAQDETASFARNLMKVFAFNVWDREDEGLGRPFTVKPEDAEGDGTDLETQSFGVMNVRGVLEASVQAANPLGEVHAFGFVPASLATDERAVVRRVTAKTVKGLAAHFGNQGMRFGWTRPKADQRSLNYTVTQDVFFEDEASGCRLPADIGSLMPGEGVGCAVTVRVRSRDVSKGERPDASGFEPIPVWLDAERTPAWRVRSVTLLSRTPDGKPFLTPERQMALAKATDKFEGFYGFDENKTPYVGWEGQIHRFVLSPEARARIETEAREEARPLTNKVVDTVTGTVSGWWPW